MRAVAVLAVTLALAGCVTGERAEFKPSVGQEAIVRDGNPALVSMKPRSVVMVKPAKREMVPGGRPVYVIAAYNAGQESTLLAVSNITVEQMVGGEPIGELKVFTYEDLVREEQARQVMAAILVGVAAGANSAAANNAGYYNSRSTVYTPRGTAVVTTTSYSPAAANIARNNAAFENAAMTASVVERGRQNLVALENQVLKDNTIMPGEWVGGQVHIAPPVNNEAGKEYRITVTVGPDVHRVDVAQKPAGG
ncbi:hypothetical protein [Ancylobacter sp. TS-1]|uniref:hypothetical protein n=1 Tax=Ancylobacter sp. TS-1 TaxID=1850374 RepID=UPI001265CCB1|nr:hypothetical protein [Ancylobacter sp. TS-1]QFR34719.1 hypothetical protein GBB76_17310 [Ancylobacter sp. TS-1]